MIAADHPTYAIRKEGAPGFEAVEISPQPIGAAIAGDEIAFDDAFHRRVGKIRLIVTIGDAGGGCHAARHPRIAAHAAQCVGATPSHGAHASAISHHEEY